MKKVAVLRKGSILSHYIFTCPMEFDKIRKVLRSPSLSWIAMGRWDVQHGETPDYDGYNCCERE